MLLNATISSIPALIPLSRNCFHSHWFPCSAFQLYAQFKHRQCIYFWIVSVPLWREIYTIVFIVNALCQPTKVNCKYFVISWVKILDTYNHTEHSQHIAKYSENGINLCIKKNNKTNHLVSQSPNKPTIRIIQWHNTATIVVQRIVHLSMDRIFGMKVSAHHLSGSYVVCASVCVWDESRSYRCNCVTNDFICFIPFPR